MQSKQKQGLNKLDFLFGYNTPPRIGKFLDLLRNTSINFKNYGTYPHDIRSA